MGFAGIVRIMKEEMTEKRPAGMTGKRDHFGGFYMKKIIAVSLTILLLFTLLTGCQKTPDTAEEDTKLHIVSTIFPSYDWVREIVGGQMENTELTLLLDKGVDLHSYQPTADDMVKISTCDLFIYVGGESDKWVDDALKNAVNKNMVAVNLLDVLGDRVKEEEVIGSMEAEEEEGEEKEAEYDEHVWLSIKNAMALCQYISDRLCGMDAENEEIYKANTAAYLEKLSTLDQEYQNTVEASSVKTVLFGDRFPFRYMAEDYGLSYDAAFAGCSAETEASFETIISLANRVDELGLKAILQIESSDGSIPNTIKANTATKDQAVLTMDSMQSTMAADIEKGATYLSIMEKNLSVLKEALQ